MTELPTFEFKGYILRPARASDHRLAKAWTEADPEHRETVNPEFWLESNATVSSCVFQDSHGPVFFFRMERVFKLNERGVELHIQFAPYTPSGSPRNIQAMRVGFEWLERGLSELGYDAVYFSSKSPRLINFCERCLGFVRQGDFMKAYLVRMPVVPPN